MGSAHWTGSLRSSVLRYKQACRKMRLGSATRTGILCSFVLCDEQSSSMM